jgi:hypothetical protein
MKDAPDYLTHEALDRVSIAAEIVESHVMRHPGLTKKERELVRKAVHKLWDVYELIGERHL